MFTNNKDANDPDEEDIGTIFLSIVGMLTNNNNYIQLLTNFTTNKFCLLWMEVEHNSMMAFNTGSGCRLGVYPMDAFLMVAAQ